MINLTLQMMLTDKDFYPSAEFRSAEGEFDEPTQQTGDD